MKILLNTILGILIVMIASQTAFSTCSLPFPTNLKLKNQTSCSLDVSWNKVSGSSYYVVEYRIVGSVTWQFTGNITGKSTTLSGLLSNATYEAAVASYCSDNTTSGFSPVVTKATKKCSAPIDLNSSGVSFATATINWTPVCGSNLFILQYRKLGLTSWTKISNITSSSYSLSNLLNATTYEYRVQADCGGAKSSWTDILTFTTLNPSTPRKNILFVVLDDARYDEFPPNGAPAWFSTPAITSIATQGVNFKLTLPTTSQCAPSRACIYTGLYPHTNGTTKNGDTLDSTLPMIQQVLKNSGYYTGFVGKFGQFLGDPQGFNWWAISAGDVYEDALYTINGVDTTITGNIIDNYQKLAMTFLNSVPEGQNFVLFYFPRAPHLPTIPRTQEASLYLNEEMPYAINHKFYTNNYPSFYSDHRWFADSLEIDSMERLRYQTIKGTDNNVDTLMGWIEEKGMLDSTLIVFTSDNGYLLGEHKLNDKILALEESIKLPLFIRYPKWFASNAVIDDEIASNLDFATTFLDFAGIENTFGFQGLSLRKIYNGEIHRKNFMYESGYDPFTAKLRAVRTLNDIFIRSYCKTTTEEYYNLVADPREDSNLIFSATYQTIIASEKILLDSLRTALADITPNKKTCNLVTDGDRLTIYADSETPDVELGVGPNPASENFSIYYSSHTNALAKLGIYDALGRLQWSRSISKPYNFIEDIDCSAWDNGLYLLKVEDGGNRYSLKIIVNH